MSGFFFEKNFDKSVDLCICRLLSSPVMFEALPDISNFNFLSGPSGSALETLTSSNNRFVSDPTIGDQRLASALTGDHSGSSTLWREILTRRFCWLVMMEFLILPHKSRFWSSSLPGVRFLRSLTYRNVFLTRFLLSYGSNILIELLSFFLLTLLNASQLHVPFL